MLSSLLLVLKKISFLDTCMISSNVRDIYMSLQQNVSKPIKRSIEVPSVDQLQKVGHSFPDLEVGCPEPPFFATVIQNCDLETPVFAQILDQEDKEWQLDA